ncbi:acetate kinase [Leuconostoc carnosum]|uniref:Acetate kinase n=2 Tax=Leuconostoc carnosum TaxID=1252 RepID=K0DAI7_LEUCJ|nr:acetate kinase [Leuconostoc carnosum]AFT81798.1 acetate kinase [Leuconostoc carnosum JB16]KAA8328386.1 acetate kinase [Leuconostoc carnosum]KAA8359578.1 acetate kinase [Leuconostoc carnosum]KAA8365153.1 acetate kinase [Leuconostoc carnosum]KAA8367522.1 acetate kinase [Leuconostoc carnosum]
MSKTMAVNAGSSSLKFQLLEMPEEKVLMQGIIERIGQESAEITIKYGADIEPKRLIGTEDGHVSLTKNGGQKYEHETMIKDHHQAIDFLLQKLTDLGIVEDFSEISGVGHRVVAGGEWFNQSVVVDDDVLSKIDRLADYAPLHNPANAMGIRAFQKLLPDALSVAVFDTSYHQTMPEKNYLYSIPYEYYTRYGARKYGAHGTSHRYVTERAAKILDIPLEKFNAISFHLGAGASVTAIKNGKSYDTSMGFTPLAGLTMATRSGDVDPSLIYYIQEREGLTNAEMLQVLNTKSGLLGISTISSDMRDLEGVQETNFHADLALNMFYDRVIRYAGQYFAELGRVDALIFTAGIGENDAVTRAKVLEALAFAGVKVDSAANNVRGKETVITTVDSSVAGLLIPTNEELMIARDVEALK